MTLTAVRAAAQWIPTGHVAGREVVPRYPAKGTPNMKKLTVGLAVLAYMLVPLALQAQDADDSAPETVIVAMATVKVPLGEDRGKFMQFIEQYVTPQEKNNPNVLAYHVLSHYYGSNSSEVVIVSVYENLAAIEAPCGAPCRDWWEANVPAEGEEGREEFEDLRDTYFKYFARHSDEVYSSNTARSKM